MLPSSLLFRASVFVEQKFGRIIALCQRWRSIQFAASGYFEAIENRRLYLELQHPRHERGQTCEALTWTMTSDCDCGDVRTTGPTIMRGKFKWPGIFEVLFIESCTCQLYGFLCLWNSSWSHCARYFYDFVTVLIIDIFVFCCYGFMRDGSFVDTFLMKERAWINSYY